MELPTFTWISRRALLTLLRLPRLPKDFDNEKARDFWEKPKRHLRLLFALLSTVLVVIGIELSTPGQHLSQQFVAFASERSETFRTLLSALADMAGIRGLAEEFQQTQLAASDLGPVLKIAVIFLLFTFAVVYFDANDPMSNTELLRNLALDARTYDGWKHFWAPPTRELRFCAQHMPSSRLRTLCADCGDLPGCGNAIGRDDPATDIAAWTTIYHSLSPERVFRLMFRVNRCRSVVLLRHALSIAIVVSAAAYAGARCFEWLRDVALNWNVELLIYIIVLWFSHWLIGIVFYRGKNARSVWGHFKDTVNELVRSEEFEILLKKHVCSRPTRIFDSGPVDENGHLIPGRGLQRLITVMRSLDNLAELKTISLLTAAGSTAEQSRNVRAKLHEILVCLTEIYSCFYKGMEFRAVLLANHLNADFLQPIVFAFSQNSVYRSLSDEVTLRQNLSRTGPSIAARCLAEGVLLSASGAAVPRFHEPDSDYCGSLIAFPLKFPKRLKGELISRDVDVSYPIGVLVIASNDESCFRKEQDAWNSRYIRPFLLRIVFELAVAAACERGVTYEED